MWVLAIILLLVALFWDKVKSFFENGIAPVVGGIMIYGLFILFAIGGGYLIQFILKQVCIDANYIVCFIISLAILIIWGKEKK
ncbi:MAG: hypothetical protein IJ532_06090 [Alphaproteobacteria bacterium]|nr:hypothetical protein [Alphaproteobacteria bacterium]